MLQAYIKRTRCMLVSYHWIPVDYMGHSQLKCSISVGVKSKKSSQSFLMIYVFSVTSKHVKYETKSGKF